MLAIRHRFGLSLLCGALLLIGASPAHAEKKHPAEEAGVKSTSGEVETKIKFVNKSKQTIKIYWLDYEGDRQLIKTIKDGESYETGATYLTHPWLITDENGDAWDVYFPDSKPRSVDIAAPAKK